MAGKVAEKKDGEMVEDNKYVHERDGLGSINFGHPVFRKYG